jgi:hypothetical protein
MFLIVFKGIHADSVGESQSQQLVLLINLPSLCDLSVKINNLKANHNTSTGFSSNADCVTYL